MKRLNNKGWLVPLVLFLHHQVMQKVLGIHILMMDNYLDPFCLGALGLYGIQMERRWLLGLRSLTILDIAAATIFLVLVSEVLFPYLSEKFVADWKDVLSIGMGSLWFSFSMCTRYGIIQKPVQRPFF